MRGGGAGWDTETKIMDATESCMDKKIHSSVLDSSPTGAEYSLG